MTYKISNVMIVKIEEPTFFLFKEGWNEENEFRVLVYMLTNII